MYRQMKQSSFRQTVLFLGLPIASLTVAFVIYLLYPPDNALFSKISLAPGVLHISQSELIQIPLFRLARFYLPDALWAMALLCLLHRLWQPASVKAALGLAISFSLFSVTMEFMQLAKSFPGYFDIADLLIYLALGATYLMKLTLTNKNKPTRRNT